MLENLSPTQRALLGNASFVPQGIVSPSYATGLQEYAKPDVSPIVGLNNVSLPATSSGGGSLFNPAPSAVAKTSGSLFPQATAHTSAPVNPTSGGSGHGIVSGPQANGPGSTAIGFADGNTIFSNGNGTYSGMGIGDNTAPQGGYITDLGSGAFTDAQDKAYGVSGGTMFNSFAKFGMLGLLGSLLAKKIPQELSNQDALSLVNSQDSGYYTPQSALNALQGIGAEKTTMQKTLDTPGGNTLFGGGFTAGGPLTTVPTGASIAANPMAPDPATVAKAAASPVAGMTPMTVFGQTFYQSPNGDFYNADGTLHSIGGLSMFGGGGGGMSTAQSFGLGWGGAQNSGGFGSDASA